jgi:hypothetical protein
VVPPEFLNFFVAGTSAGAALVGLLFVAVSIAPEQMVTRRAPIERQAVAGSAFTALMNAFFISLVALIPHVNFGTFVVPFSLLSLLTSLVQAWHLLRQRKSRMSFLRRAFLVFFGLAVYGLELVYAVSLIISPAQIGYVYNMIFLLLGVFALGLVRAWELLGVHRYGFFGWLNPLQNVNTDQQHAYEDTVEAASPQSETDEAAPHPPQ